MPVLALPPARSRNIGLRKIRIVYNCQTKARSVLPVGCQCKLNLVNNALPSPAPSNQADRFAGTSMSVRYWRE